MKGGYCPLRGMRRKRVWKMPLRGRVFAQFSAGALNYYSNYTTVGTPADGMSPAAPEEKKAGYGKST